MMAHADIAIGRSNEFEEGTDRWYEMTKKKGGSFEGILRVRTQWRHITQGQQGVEDWSPLPDVEEDDDEIPIDDVADFEESLVAKARKILKDVSGSKAFGVTVMCAVLVSIIAMVRIPFPS